MTYQIKLKIFSPTCNTLKNWGPIFLILFPNILLLGEKAEECYLLSPCSPDSLSSHTISALHWPPF